MHINVFMGSGGSVAERNILKNFMIGLEPWLDENNIKNPDWNEATRIGRWRGSAAIPEYRAEFVYEESWQPCDVAVIFGSWKPREKGSHITRSAVAANAKRFVVIETPLLNRVTDSPNQYWRVGVNGYLNRDALWPSLPRDYAGERLKHLGIKWQGWQNDPNGHVVVALQLPGDASLRGCDINDWAFQTIMALRQHTDRTIVVRNHPLCSSRAFSDHETLALRLMQHGVTNIRFSDGYLVPWSQDLAGSYCTVAYTSGLAIDSVLAGIPTISCDPGNFAWGFSSRDASEIENVRRAPDATIETWLRHLAGCQWSLEEMRSGLVWQHILPILEHAS